MKEVGYKEVSKVVSFEWYEGETMEGTEEIGKKEYVLKFS